eukprot:CAMPEP_0177610474 /NCGR_PEP_ID=MMETSP0419_2-20121207/19801_1 /TAXON_ID=582737 /ORGANISM="Tetraselmis sp., Strain GSL018" /LENGTH=133 /DNA_ID=CAMNT_0019105787 /DNA_START=184 /DNA_END=585 /DNA_ORIENTATION=-
MKARAKQTLDHMIKLKQEREHQREIMHEVLLTTMRSTLAALQEADAPGDARRAPTEEERRLISECVSEVDTLMDEKAEATFRDMDKHMERLLEIRALSPEAQESALSDLAEGIVAQRHNAGAHEPSGGAAAGE